MKRDQNRGKMISIWAWVGLVLCTYGILILGTGLWHLNSAHSTVLGEIQPRIWWGVIMVLFGVLFLAVLGRRR